MKKQLHRGDCVRMMKNKIADESIDLTVTSPPYDDLRTYNGGKEWNQKKWEAVLRELYRVTAAGGAVVWIVADAYENGSETGSSFKQALFAKEIGFNLNDTMIWAKPGFSNPGNISVRYPQTFEYMFVFTKGMPKTFNPIMDRKNKHVGTKINFNNRKRDGSMKPCYVRKRPTRKKIGRRFNVWNLDHARGISKHHPAPFPVKLAADHIVTWSNPGDLVLDPFMGSGSTGVAAIENARNFVGIELDKEYFKIAKNRIGETFVPLVY